MPVHGFNALCWKAWQVWRPGVTDARMSIGCVSWGVDVLVKTSNATGEAKTGSIAYSIGGGQGAQLWSSLEQLVRDAGRVDFGHG